MSGDQKEDKKILYCSFCGKGQYDIRKLIAGPDVFICNECIDLCVGICNEEEPQSEGEKKYLVDVTGSALINAQGKEFSHNGAFVIAAMTAEEAVNKLMHKKTLRIGMGRYMPTSNIADIRVRAVEEIAKDTDKAGEIDTDRETK